MDNRRLRLAIFEVMNVIGGSRERIHGHGQGANLCDAKKCGDKLSRIRQRELLQQTAASLQRSLAVIGEGEELAAEDLRAAAYSLGRLLGRVDVEDILDVIFREFCIGK